MKYRLLDILVCPDCLEVMKLTVYKREEIPWSNFDFDNKRCKYYCSFSDIGELIDCNLCYRFEVLDGMLKCDCGKMFPIIDGIPRTLEDIGTKSTIKYLIKKYDKSQSHQQEDIIINMDTYTTYNYVKTKRLFDFEWTKFNYGQRLYGQTAQEELNDFFHRMKIDREFLKGKLILDAGCGMGRLVRELYNFYSECVGIELSQGIDEVYKCCCDLPFLYLVQGDILNPPFRSNYFDYVYAKGVLHYVPDAKEAFRKLVPLLKDKASISITVYHKMPRYFMLLSNLIRKLTLGFPPFILYYLCFIPIPFYQLFIRLSGVRYRHIEWKERLHIIYNWFSAEYQNSHTEEEVIGWFKEFGFNELRVSDVRVGITGIKVRNLVGRLKCKKLLQPQT